MQISTRLILGGLLLIALFAARQVIAVPPAAQAQVKVNCITCHTKETPAIVTQWKSGRMGKKGMDCAACHGADHTTAEDAANAKMPTPDTCVACHAQQVEQFRAGKHALAWTAMKAMPMLSHQPQQVAGPDGFQGCAGCHKIGEKPPGELTPAFHYGTGSCDACHTRHSFAVQEARDPRACQTCHMGFDHPQWEMWSSSRHGVIWQIEGDTGRAPTCQTCHMDEGNHAVMTAWGFWALRVPEDDPPWWQDRLEILKALGVLDETGEATDRMEAVKAARMVRLTQEDFQAERARAEAICARCHSARYVTEQMSASDQIIRAADALMAEAIRTVKALYAEGLLKTPAGWKYAPDLLQFYEADSSVEQELYVMFMEYRMRAFQGAFHTNPDYMHWYGWAAMKESLQTIQAQAAALRAGAADQASQQSSQQEIGQLKSRLDTTAADIEQLNEQVAKKQEATSLPLLASAGAGFVGLVGLALGLVALARGQKDEEGAGPSGGGLPF